MNSPEHIKGNFYRDFSGKKHEYFLLIDGEKKMLTGVTSVTGMLGGEGKIRNLQRYAVKTGVEYIKDQSDKEEHGYLVFDSTLDEAITAFATRTKEAGQHGTDRHALVEEYINICFTISELDGMTRGKPVVNYAGKYEPIQAFCDWAVENVDHFLYAERPVHSPELHLAGTIDFGFVGKDGRRYVGDFKTSSGVYDISYFTQVAAYKMLAEGEGDEKYDGTVIVRHGKDGSFEDLWRYDTTTDEEAFRALLVLYRASATFVKPKK